MRWSVALLLLTVARAALANEPIQTQTIVRENPLQRIYIARIDLTDPRVQIVVANGGADPDGPGPWETVLRQTSVTARVNDLRVAVNANFFGHQTPDNDMKKYAAGEPAMAANTVIIDGRRASPAAADALMWFDKENHGHIGTVNGQPPEGAWQAVAGSTQIVTDGKNTGDDKPDRHPRTAAGLTADGRTLVLLVADGRRAGWALGLSQKELADEMIAQGCRDAINLDGGGSSTMVARDPDGKTKVINTPSDGSLFMIPLSVERPVAYVLGVRLTPAK